MKIENFDFLKVSPYVSDKKEYFEVNTLVKFVDASYGNWKIIDKFNDKGYNGNIYRVVNKRGVKGLLKLPRIRSIDNEKTSKQNLITEIKNLLLLTGHPNIQLILDSDIAENNPFLVYKEIVGSTLDKIVKNKLIEPQKAILATINLLDTLQFCHNKNIVHRDIKPDNIICRNDDINDMVLIDFGLSTTANSSSEKDWNRICCNRSIALPELFLGTNKSDPRSDISYVCCGVLFYMLYGFLPRMMTDGMGMLPTTIEPARTIHNNWPPRIQEPIMNFFRKAYYPNIDQRYQNIKEAQSELKNILKLF